MLQLHITLQQVYVNIATTTPHNSEPPLLHGCSHLFFLGCAHKHPYQNMIQRDLLAPDMKCVLWFVLLYCN